MRMLKRIALFALAAPLLALTTPLAAQAPHDYAFADSVSRAAPESAGRSVQALGAYFRDALPGERDRARGIYRWITDNIAYDIGLYLRGGFLMPPSQDPTSMLRTRKGVCEGYSALFQALSTVAGLEAVTILGQAKALSTDPRRPYRTQQHAWNAVKVDGRWALLDATWGAGDINLPERRFERRQRDFFFDTPPAKLIWSHRASQERWQMLEQPLSAREFERLPFTHRDFWELGFPAQLVFDAVRQEGFEGFAGVFTAAGHSVEIMDAPLNRTLVPGQAHAFRLRAPGADSVIAVSGSSWQYLRQEGDAWVGTAALADGEMVVMVRYPDIPAGAIVLRYESGVLPGDRRRGR
ncbi:MAG TPA: transglutaminase domain-containing protein [Longimicrobium sp.]|uniref:transglutaminase domain-containing protein n=1 Tax=Longimicrobium sp. TaxID=2029185 RepID=UPI002EDB2ED8